MSTVGQGNFIMTPGPGQTPRFVANVSSSSTLDNAAAATAPGAAPSVTMTWTFQATDEWQVIATSLRP